MFAETRAEARSHRIGARLRSCTTRLLVEIQEAFSNDAEHLSVEVSIVRVRIQPLAANDFVQEHPWIGRMLCDQTSDVFR